MSTKDKGNMGVDASAAASMEVDSPMAKWKTHNQWSSFRKHLKSIAFRIGNQEMKTLFTTT